MRQARRYVLAALLVPVTACGGSTESGPAASPTADADARSACRETAALLEDSLGGAVTNDTNFAAQINAIHDSARYSKTPGIASNSRELVARFDDSPDTVSPEFVRAAIRLNIACKTAGLDFAEGLTSEQPTEASGT